MKRQEAINIFFKAIDHDDPYWCDLVEEFIVLDENDNAISWPNQFDVALALGFTVEEIESLV